MYNYYYIDICAVNNEFLSNKSLLGRGKMKRIEGKAKLVDGELTDVSKKSLKELRSRYAML